MYYQPNCVLDNPRTPAAPCRLQHQKFSGVLKLFSGLQSDLIPGFYNLISHFMRKVEDGVGKRGGEAKWDRTKYIFGRDRVHDIGYTKITENDNWIIF